MNSESRAHLSDEALDALLASASLGLCEASAHIEQCQDCQARMTRLRQADERLGTLHETGTETVLPDCASEPEWRELAAGLMPAATADRLLEHALTCKPCGAKLRTVIDEISGSEEPTWPPTSAATLNRKELTRKLAATPHRGATLPKAKPDSSGFRRYAIAAGVVLALAGAVLMRTGWHRADEYAAAEVPLLDFGRTLELRLPNAPYSPVTVARSASSTNAAVAREEARVLSALEKQPDDITLRLQKSRIDILRRRYPVAIETLAELPENSKTRPDVSRDIGIAWLARGLNSQDSSHLTAAVENLSRALEANPNDLVALFNRALAEERLSMLEGAERDWLEYLKLDSSTGWSDEARQHLDRVRKKKATGNHK